jgi:ribonuclease VapC
MPLAVLDASAVLALLRMEPGWREIAPLRRRSLLTTVNAAEVAQVLMRVGAALDRARRIVDEFGAEIVSFDFDLAMRAAALEGVTRLRGLSLGDRACLALAQRSGLPAITMDKAWAEVAAGVVVRVVR